MNEGFSLEGGKWKKIVVVDLRKEFIIQKIVFFHVFFALIHAHQRQFIEQDYYLLEEEGDQLSWEVDFSYFYTCCRYLPYLYLSPDSWLFIVKAENDPDGSLLIWTGFWQFVGHFLFDFVGVVGDEDGEKLGEVGGELVMGLLESWEDIGNVGEKLFVGLVSGEEEGLGQFADDL